MPPAVLAIWVVSGLLCVLGAAGVVVAARRGPARDGERTSCACCGYSTAGLEDDRCPECGMRFADAAHALGRTRRRRLVLAGVAAMALATLGFPAANIAEVGLARGLPSIVLIESLWLAPEWGDAAATELRFRAESGLLRPWERWEMARVCRAALRGSDGVSSRRRAANLLARAPGQAGAETGAAMLGDADGVVRAAGATLIERQGRAGKAVRSRLATLACNDRSPLVRKRAIDALGHLRGGGPEAQNAIGHGLTDANEGVRRRALVATVYWQGDEDGPRPLEAMASVAIADADEGVREMAVSLMGMLAERRRGVLNPGAAGVGLMGG